MTHLFKAEHPQREQKSVIVLYENVPIHSGA
jgi:hypothetical protein